MDHILGRVSFVLLALPASGCGNGCLGAIAGWEGLVNVHYLIDEDAWVSDPDGTSGYENVDTESERLEYCFKFFPGTLSVSDTMYRADEIMSDPNGWSCSRSWLTNLCTAAGGVNIYTSDGSPVVWGFCTAGNSKCGYAGKNKSAWKCMGTSASAIYTPVIIVVVIVVVALVNYKRVRRRRRLQGRQQPVGFRAKPPAPAPAVIPSGANAVSAPHYGLGGPMAPMAQAAHVSSTPMEAAQPVAMAQPVLSPPMVNQAITTQAITTQTIVTTTTTSSSMTSAGSAAQPLDTTGDGIANAVAVDTTGDGRVDTVLPVAAAGAGHQTQTGAPFGQGMGWFGKQQ